MTGILLTVAVVAVVLLLAPLGVLAAGIDRPRAVDQEMGYSPLCAAARLYRGALVGRHHVLGGIKAFEVCDDFVGIAYEDKDNSSGAAAALSAKFYTAGDFTLPLTSVAEADVGKAVFATADDAIALKGHYDAYVGRIVRVYATNYAVVRLKAEGEKPLPSDTGAFQIASDFENGLPLLTDAAETVGNNGKFQLVRVLGLGVLGVEGANGGANRQLDATNEASNGTIQSLADFDVTKGITLEGRFNVETASTNAVDVDFGLCNVVNTTTRANLDDATMTKGVRFHIDGGSNDILAQAIGGATTAATDTTIDNVATAVDADQKTFVILLRPGGLAELYINGARVLSTTVFNVSATGVFAAIFNVEKSASTATALSHMSRMRVAGGRL